MLGLVGLNGEKVGKGRTQHDFTCRAECTRQSMDDDEVTIFMESHHMHAHGKKMTNEIYRGGDLVHTRVPPLLSIGTLT